MKQAMLTALCTLLLLSVALGGVGYSDTVNFLEKTVGGLADNLERVKGLFGNKSSVEPPETDILETRRLTGIDENMTLKEFIIHFAKDDGCIIPDITSIYPNIYECVIEGHEVAGVRFTYDGNEFYYWDICGWSTGGAWNGYNVFWGLIPKKNTHVVKVGAGNFHYSSEHDLNDLRLNPHNWRFNTTVRESNINVVDYFRSNID